MYAAARSFGADAMSLMLPPPPPGQAMFIRTGNISSTIVANSKKALEFLKMADFVIDNSGTVEDLTRQIGGLWDWMRSMPQLPVISC